MIKVDYKKPEIIEPPKTTAVSILPKKTNRNNQYEKCTVVNNDKSDIETKPYKKPEIIEPLEAADRTELPS